MRFSLSGSMGLAWSDAVELVTMAEGLGFDAFYASDHLQGVDGFSDPEAGVLDSVTLLAGLAARTTRIRLGCLVSPVTVRSPVDLARALSAADHISGGRIEIGIGAGWMAEEHLAYGYPFPSAGKRLRMLEESAEVISRLWESESPVTFHGEFWTLASAAMRPRPIQSRAPILIAGASAAALRSAARFGRSWNVLGTPAYLREKVASLREAERAAQRSDPVLATIMLMVELTDDPDQAEELRTRIANVGVDRSQAAFATADESAADAASGRFLAATPSQLRARIAEYEEAGVDTITFVLPPPYRPARLKDLADVIMH